MHLNLPTLIDLPRAAEPARGPRTVGDADEEGRVHGRALRLPELQDEGQQCRVDVPDGREDEDDDRETGHAPHEPHLDLEQPKAEAFDNVSAHSF